MKITNQFFIELERGICKFIWNNKSTGQQKLPNNKRTSRSSDIKLYSQEIVVRNIWYRESQEDQWKRIEDQEMNPHTCGPLIFDKGTKTIQWETDIILMLVQLDVIMQKNVHLSIPIFLYKYQAQVYQGPPHKTTYTEPKGRGSVGEL